MQYRFEKGREHQTDLQAVSGLHGHLPLEGGRRKGASSPHNTNFTTISSSHKIPYAVTPYQTCAFFLTLNEVAKYMEFRLHPRCKEQPPLAEDLRKKILRTTLRYWLQNNLKMEWAFKPESQGRTSHR
jgi:hypothetical protein